MTLATSYRTGLTRAEAYARVVALRRDGRTHAEIAAMIGCSRSYVHCLICDPDGSKTRTRKQNALKVTCEACGASCWGRVCADCQNRAQHDASFWTRERLLAAAREWRLRFGDWPVVREWRRVQRIDGYVFPTFSTCYEPIGTARKSCRAAAEFHSWSEFLVAAGADPGDVKAGVRRRLTPA